MYKHKLNCWSLLSEQQWWWAKYLSILRSKSPAVTESRRCLSQSPTWMETKYYIKVDTSTQKKSTFCVLCFIKKASKRTKKFRLNHDSVIYCIWSSSEIYQTNQCKAYKWSSPWQQLRQIASISPGLWDSRWWESESPVESVGLPCQSAGCLEWSETEKDAVIKMNSLHLTALHHPLTETWSWFR